MRTPNQRTLQRWLLMMLVMGAFAIRVYRLDAQDIWWDEARNLDVAARPVTQIANAGELDIHPPLYFFILHGWLELSGGAAPSGQDAAQDVGRLAFVARFLSLWFGVLFVALMYALGRRVGRFWTGLGVAVGAVFLPFLLGEAQEARMYTMVLVWLAAAGLAVWMATAHAASDIASQEKQVDWARGFSRFLASASRPAKASNLGYWLLFACFSALALLTHYAAVFALVALWGWAGLQALWGGRAGLWRRLRAVLLAGLAAALFCLPGLPVALRQIPSYRNPNLVIPSVGVYLAELARVYGLGEHIDTTAARPWAWGLAGLLIIGWLLWMMNRRPNASTHPTVRRLPFATRHFLFAILWAFLPLLVYYLVITDRSTFAARYIAGALPGWLLLVGLAVAGWARFQRVAGGVAALAVGIVFVPGLIGDLTNPTYFREDTRGMVAWLQQEVDPVRDVILVDQRYPFGLYWPRWNSSADGFPPAEPAGLAPAQYLFVDINTVAERLASLARGRQRVFLVRWFESDTDPRGATAWVLEKFGTQLGERSFRGYQVVWYEVPSEADFELAPGFEGSAVEFGDQVRLDEYAFGGRGPGITSTIAETRAPLAPANKSIWVVGRWSRLAGAVEPGKALPRGLKATVVLEDVDGVVVGRDDRPILNDRHLAPSEWSEVDRSLGVYQIRPEPATSPGTYTLRLAVYDPAGMAQLPLAAADGTFVTLGQVTLTQATRAPDMAQLPIETPLTFAWQGLRLLGRGSLPIELAPGDRLAFDLFWQAEQETLPELQARFALSPVELAAAEGPAWQAPVVKDYATSAWAVGEVARGRQYRRLDNNTPAGTYLLMLRLVDTAEAATSPQVVLGQVVVTGRSHVFEPPARMAQRSGARFGELATLLGYDLVAPATRPGVLDMILYWRADAASMAPYAVSVQLLDAGGVLRAQRDQQPGDGAFPTTGWVAGEVLTDAYRVVLPADLPAGSYTVVVKLYDPETGPLSVTGADAVPVGELLRLATVKMP